MEKNTINDNYDTVCDKNHNFELLIAILYS